MTRAPSSQSGGRHAGGGGRCCGAQTWAGGTGAAGATVLAVVLGAEGFWIGGRLGAGVGVAVGALMPLWIERETRRQETTESARGTQVTESARGAQVLSREHGPAHLLEPGLGVVPFTGRAAELEALERWCLDVRAGRVRLVSGEGGSGKTRLALELGKRLAGRGWRFVQVGEGRELYVVGLERAALLARSCC